MSNHAFCRLYLKDIMAQVRERFPKEIIKRAWAWKHCCDGYEFHIEEHNHHVYPKHADCLWSAKAYGWEDLMKKIDREGDEE